MSHGIHVTVAGRVGSGYVHVARMLESALKQAGVEVDIVGHTADYSSTQAQIPPGRPVTIEIHQLPNPLIESE